MARTSAEYWTSILLNNLMSDQEESLNLHNIAEINRVVRYVWVMVWWFGALVSGSAGSNILEYQCLRVLLTRTLIDRHHTPKDIQCYLPRIRRHSSFVSTIYHQSLRQAPDRTSDHVHQRAPMRPTASHILNRNTLICFNVIIRQSTAMRGISRKNQNELRLWCGCSKVHFHSSLLRIEVVLQEMGKRRYLNLSGGPFREGDEPKNKQNKKEESIGRKNEDDPTNEEEQEEEEVEIEQRELSQCAERKELGPCETPRRKFVKRKHRKFDSGISFRCNSQFGGFSRTNAAPHYQYERGKGTERYRTRRPNEPNEDRILYGS